MPRRILGPGTEHRSLLRARRIRITTATARAFRLDLGYRINKQNKLSGGYDWLENKFDALTTQEPGPEGYAQLANSALANLDVRFKYQYLQRRSAFQEPFVAPTMSAWVFFFMRQEI